MAIDTIEEAYAEFCRKMPSYAQESRRVALAGGVHRITIDVRDDEKRGLIANMDVSQRTKGVPGGTFLDLK